MAKTSRWCLGRFVVVLALVALTARADGVPAVLGHVSTPPLSIDGLAVPVGTTIYSPALVAARRGKSLILLGRGRTLKIEDESSALLEGLPDGRIKVSVVAGSVSYLRAKGKKVYAREKDVFILGVTADEPVERIPINP